MIRTQVASTLASFRNRQRGPYTYMGLVVFFYLLSFYLSPEVLGFLCATGKPLATVLLCQKRQLRKGTSMNDQLKMNENSLSILILISKNICIKERKEPRHPPFK